MCNILIRTEIAGGEEFHDDSQERLEREELSGLEIDDSLAWFCIENSCRTLTSDLDCWGHVSPYQYSTLHIPID
jgi:hypothetical protein